MADVVSLIRAGQSISTLSRLSNVVTVTLSLSYPNDNLKVGQSIRLYGNSPSSFNLTGEIATVTSQSVFTMNQVGIDESATVVGVAGGDYIDLTTWESSENRDLTVLGEIATAECYNDWSAGLTEFLVIAGWGTSPTSFPRISVPLSERHIGKSRTGFYIKNANQWQHLLNLGSGYAEVIGLCLYNSADNSGTIWLGAANTKITDFYAEGRTTSYSVLTFNNSNTKALNGTVVKQDGTAISVLVNNSNTYLSNLVLKNIVVRGRVGFSANVFNVLVQNVAAFADSGTCFSIGAASYYHASNSNNASTDLTAPGTSPVTGINSSDFLDASTNYLVPSLNSALSGAGVDLSTDFTTDCLGINRNYAGKPNGWDIGPFRAFFEEIKSVRVSGFGGDYVDLTTWFSVAATLEGEANDLTKVNKSIVAELYNDDPVNGLIDNVAISGLVVNTYYKPIIRAANGEKHSGIPTSGGDYTGAALVSTGANWFEALDIRITNILVQSLIVQHNASGAIQITEGAGIGNGLVFENILYVGGNDVNGSVSGYRNLFKNCIIFNPLGAGFGNFNFYGHTLLSCGVANAGAEGIKGFGGDAANDAITAVNTWVFNAVGQSFPTTMYSAGSSTNASDDVVADHASVTVLNLASTDFTDAANDDYSLAVGSALIGAGTDLTGVNDTDILGVSWTTPYDIGPFKSAGGAGTPVVASISSRMEFRSRVESGRYVETERMTMLQRQRSQLLESVKNIAKQSAGIQESATALINQAITAIENNQGSIAVISSVLSMIESIGAVSKQSPITIESLVDLAKSLSLPSEAIEAVSNSENVTTENKLRSASELSSIESEALADLSTSQTLQTENLKAISDNKGVSTENSITLSFQSISSSEHVKSISPAAEAAIESGQGLISIANAVVSNIESLQSIADSELVELESNAGFVSVNAALASQTESIQAVVSLLSSETNNLAPLVSGRTIIVESTQSLIAVTPGDVSLEILNRVKASPAQPFAFIKAVSSSAKGQFQTTATIVATGQEAFELLKVVDNGYQSNNEVLQLLQSVSSSNIEFFTPGFSLYYIDFIGLISEFIDSSSAGIDFDETVVKFIDTSSSKES